MMINIVQAVAECDDGITWTHVAVFAILVAGIVAWAWVANQ
jgi:hypothetical protein